MDLRDVSRTEGIATRALLHPVPEAVKRLTLPFESKGMMVFAVIDRSGEAARLGVNVPDTKLLLFGSQAGGTPVMFVLPLAAIDPPLKIMVWADSHGQSCVSYNTPEHLAERHHLSDALADRLKGIPALTDALLAADA